MSFLQKLFSSKQESLGDMINAGAFLVDVRSKSEFSAGHVEGSTNIPLDSLQNQLHQLKGKDKIVLVCQSGMRSAQAKILLNKNGVQNVVNGGSWSKVNSLKR